jgi:hypothetical protein
MRQGVKANPLLRLPFRLSKDPQWLARAYCTAPSSQRKIKCSGDSNNGNGRAPEFILKIGLRGGYQKRCGAGWRTKDGRGLNIKLDPGIALVGANDISITLWKNDEQQQARSPQQQSTSRVLEDDDNIPY